MAQDYTVTGQKEAKERQSDGTFMDVVEVSFETTTTPPFKSTVAVPKTLLRDKVQYASTVKEAIEQAVVAHAAVAYL